MPSQDFTKAVASATLSQNPVARNPFGSKSILSQNPVAQNPFDKNPVDLKIPSFEIHSNSKLRRTKSLLGTKYLRSEPLFGNKIQSRNFFSAHLSASVICAHIPF